MAQGYIDQILYNQETNALLLQAETYRSDIEAITICMIGDSAKVKSIVWRCISRLESTGLECHARTINELVLQDAVVKAINQMLGDKSSYQAQLQLNIASVIRASQATSVENNDEKLMALQQELIQKAQSKEAYNEIADEIFRLRELRQQTTIDTAARDEQIKRINDLQDYIAQQTTHLTEFDYNHFKWSSCRIGCHHFSFSKNHPKMPDI